MVKYIDIADDLRSKIFEKKYTYGQKLPYEYVLCVAYHCNKETMKKALDILVKEGLIVRRRGAGTFVKDYDASSEHIAKSKQSGLGLTKQFEGKAKVTSDVIEFEVVPSDEHISKKLQIEEGSFVYHIIRRRVVDGESYCLEIQYMPISIIPNLKLEHVKGSIYSYVEKELKLKIQSTHKTIRAHLSSQLEQEYLGLKDYEPYIEVEEVAYLSSGVIFEYSFARYHYNKFELQTVNVQQ